MPPTSSPLTQPALSPGDAATQSLWAHRQHVFIFTRAGKPIFSLHGEEERHSPLFALFQVLLHMDIGGDDDHDNNYNRGGGGASASSSPSPDAARDSEGAEDEVRQMVYYAPYPDPAGCGVREVQSLTIFSYVHGELMYVMTQRSTPPSEEHSHCGSGTSNSTAESAELARSNVLFAAPPVASYCAAQLRHMHHFVLLVLPNINALLTQQPSLDVLSTYTESDRAALREMIASYASRLNYAVGAMATLSLSVERRRVVEAALLASYRCAADPAVGPPAQQLFSFLFYRDYLVAAVGPPEVYAASAADADRAAPLAFAPADACCGGLHVDDALLLYRYARSLIHRQVGEAWAPLCLPRFNSTGYLWCYAVNFSRHIRELRGERGLPVWPAVWADGKSESDVLLIHISAGQDDFTALSRCTRRLAQLLYSPAIGDDFYLRLEEEMHLRSPALLTELLGPLQPAKHGERPPASLPCALSGSGMSPLPLWYGLVLQGGSGKFLLSEEMAEQTRSSAAAAAAVTAFAARAIRSPSADVRLLLECQPSPQLQLTTLEDVAAFQQCVVRYQAQLRALLPSSSPATPSLLLVRHSSTVSFALMQPSVATLTTLAQHFFDTTAPFAVPVGADEGKGAGEGEEGESWSAGQRGSTRYGERGDSGRQQQQQPPPSESSSSSRHGVAFSAWVEAVASLGVTELTVAFAATTPEPLMWYWVARVLYMAVLRRRRYVVRQLIGGKTA